MSRIETKKPSLPTKVLKDINQSLAQANRGETVSHADAMKQIRVWRKRYDLSPGYAVHAGEGVDEFL